LSLRGESESPDPSELLAAKGGGNLLEDGLSSDPMVSDLDLY